MLLGVKMYEIDVVWCLLVWCLCIELVRLEFEMIECWLVYVIELIECFLVDFGDLWI